MLPPIARRFVAGETAAEAIHHAHRLDDRGVGAILNLLGEHYDRPLLAAADREAYARLLEDLARSDVRACVSVKPSQLGLGVDEETFRSNARSVVAAAHERDVFVWFDMEDHRTTDATLDAYETFAEEYGGVGVCLQANLRRTREDLQRLVDTAGKVRLVKGAYDEPESIAYRRPERVNRELRELLRVAFERREGGIALGSHDPAMIDHAISLHEEYGADFELQLLMGVREDAQYELAEAHDVWQYVPYGDRWLSYFYRRMTERKENLRFALRALREGVL